MYVSIVMDSEDIVKLAPMSYSGKEMAEQSEFLTPTQELERLRQENQALKTRIEGLEQLVTKDELTGVDNRRSFNEEMHREVARTIRGGKSIAIAFVDIDNFKGVNDKEGHPAGDSTLIRVAAVLNNSLRETDRVFRYGGEEFVMILPDTSLHHAIAVSERLRLKLANSPVELDNKQINVTASFGVSSFTPTGQDTQIPQEEIIISTIDNLMETADQAMYAAKKAGRNKTGFGYLDGRINVLEQDPKNPRKMLVRSCKPIAPTSTHK